MTTKMQTHRDKVLAEKQGKSTQPNGAQPSTSQDLQSQKLTALQNHQIALKAIQSITEKIRMKATFLPEYAGYVAGVLASGAGMDDPVLSTIFVWRMDCGDFVGAMEIADYMLDHGLTLPQAIKRNLPTFIMEELADAVLDKQNPDALEPLQDALELTSDMAKDMPDEVRAKAHKALGLTMTESDPVQAIVHLEEALRLHKGAGVKTRLDKLKKSMDDAAKDKPTTEDKTISEDSGQTPDHESADQMTAD